MKTILMFVKSGWGMGGMGWLPSSFRNQRDKSVLGFIRWIYPPTQQQLHKRVGIGIPEPENSKMKIRDGHWHTTQYNICVYIIHTSHIYIYICTVYICISSFAKFMEIQLLKLKFALRMGIDADPRAEPKLDCKEDNLLKFSGTLVISLKTKRMKVILMENRR